MNTFWTGFREGDHIRSHIAKFRCMLFSTVFLCAASGCERSEPLGELQAITHPKTVITALIWAPDWSDQMQQIAEAFTRENPNIHVNVQFMIGESVEENIRPRIAAGNMPDLLSVNPNTFTAELADRGKLVDVSLTTAWATMLDDLKPDWTSAGKKHFGVAGGVAATLLYYNMNLFKQAGIGNVPSNFDEFLKTCDRLKKAGITPIIWYGGFPNMLGNGPFSSGFANNIVANEPRWKDKLIDGTLNLDVPEAADIFEKIKLIADRGYVQKGFMTTNYDEGIKLFTSGKVAMAFHGTWASGLLMQGKNFETGVFIPPWNAPRKKPVPVIGSETGFAVGATTHRKEALLFLEYIMGKGYPILQNKRQNIPPMRHPQGTMIGNPLITKYILRVSEFSVTASPYYSFLPATTIGLTHSLMQDVLFNKRSPREAAVSLNQSIKNEARSSHK